MKKTLLLLILIISSLLAGCNILYDEENYRTLMQDKTILFSVSIIDSELWDYVTAEFMAANFTNEKDVKLREEVLQHYETLLEEINDTTITDIGVITGAIGYAYKQQAKKIVKSRIKALSYADKLSDADGYKKTYYEWRLESNLKKAEKTLEDYEENIIDMMESLEDKNIIYRQEIQLYDLSHLQ